jgi:hypothetical protein
VRMPCGDLMKWGAVGAGMLGLAPCGGSRCTFASGSGQTPRGEKREVRSPRGVCAHRACTLSVCGRVSAPRTVPVGPGSRGYLRPDGTCFVGPHGRVATVRPEGFIRWVFRVAT